METTSRALGRLDKGLGSLLLFAIAEAVARANTFKGVGQDAEEIEKIAPIVGADCGHSIPGSEGILNFDDKPLYTSGARG